MLNFLACTIGSLGIYAGGALRDAKVEMSRMLMFVFAMIYVCAALLFRLKPKPELLNAAVVPPASQPDQVSPTRANS